MMIFPSQALYIRIGWILQRESSVQAFRNGKKKITAVISFEKKIMK
jgi:hypothetical protein